MDCSTVQQISLPRPASRADWKKLDDLAAQLEEFDLRCTLGDYDSAANILLEVDFDYLLLWGHYRLMIELHEKLQGKITDNGLAASSVGNLGQAYHAIGKVWLAIEYEGRALQIGREENNRSIEAVWLGNLGNAYSDLGEVA